MANDEYRDQHQAAREVGLAARHETRVERAIRVAKGELIDQTCTFVQAINSDLDTWTYGECQEFLRTFANECQPLIREIRWETS